MPKGNYPEWKNKAKTIPHPAAGLPKWKYNAKGELLERKSRAKEQHKIDLPAMVMSVMPTETDYNTAKELADKLVEKGVVKKRGTRFKKEDDNPERVLKMASLVADTDKEEYVDKVSDFINKTQDTAILEHQAKRLKKKMKKATDAYTEAEAEHEPFQPPAKYSHHLEQAQSNYYATKKAYKEHLEDVREKTDELREIHEEHIALPSDMRRIARDLRSRYAGVFSERGEILKYPTEESKKIYQDKLAEFKPIEDEVFITTIDPRNQENVVKGLGQINPSVEVPKVNEVLFPDFGYRNYSMPRPEQTDKGYTFYQTKDDVLEDVKRPKTWKDGERVRDTIEFEGEDMAYGKYPTYAVGKAETLQAENFLSFINQKSINPMGLTEAKEVERDGKPIVKKRPPMPTIDPDEPLSVMTPQHMGQFMIDLNIGMASIDTPVKPIKKMEEGEYNFKYDEEIEHHPHGQTQPDPAVEEAIEETTSIEPTALPTLANPVAVAQPSVGSNDPYGYWGEPTEQKGYFLAGNVKGSGHFFSLEEAKGKAMEYRKKGIKVGGITYNPKNKRYTLRKDNVIKQAEGKLEQSWVYHKNKSPFQK